jgi:hypothetical protein
MPQSLLITRPFYDLTTSYLNKFSLEVVKNAKIKLRSVVDLNEKRANRKEFESVLKKVKPDLVIINGHGNSELVLGNSSSEVLVKVGENEYILKDTVVFSLSCSSAKKLGVSSIEAGASAYIGYNEDFIFAYTEGYSTRAEQDPLAKLFLDPTNRIANSLIEGYSPEDAHKRGVNAFLENLQKVLLSNSKEEYLARYLVWDLTNQVCLT